MSEGEDYEWKGRLLKVEGGRITTKDGAFPVALNVNLEEAKKQEGKDVILKVKEGIIVEVKIKKTPIDHTQWPI
ncbi:MAG: hypothetical protein L6N95_00200 [Candidatus Methylarchaceae archaeon HK01B]|nr:hypothetical protein [Candidatus Methylarchaceae archaeon HK01B]